MNPDLISGLVLAAVALLGLGYLLKEIFGDSIRAFIAEHRAEPPGGANTHLIGATGRVVDSGDGGLRVRVGMERWSARPAGSESRTLPVGTEVEVRAVDGRVLEVEEKAGD